MRKTASPGAAGGITRFVVAAALGFSALAAAWSSPPSPSSVARPANRPHLPPPDAKSVQAVRTTEPITLDGRLDEAVWKAAVPATGFTQNDPQDGSPATEPTEVWVAYDEHALYVAAFCHDTEPSKIRKRLGRRVIGVFRPNR